MYNYLHRFFFRVRLNFRKVKAYALLGRWQVWIYDNVSIPYKPYSIRVGKNLSIYNNCVIEICGYGKVNIGNNCIFSYGVLIAITNELSMGDDVLIGEYTSIRDTTHNYSLNEISIKCAVDKSEKIKIGNNVWIGRGCIILPGSIIEDGVVVASNSTVKGVLKKDGIYGGNPVKYIKQRK